MYKLINAVKAFQNGDNKVLALNNVSIEINNGDFVAVMGVSGSGKSTLLNILGCMDELTAGDYYADEECVSKLKLDKYNEFRRKNIGFIFQHFALMDSYTIGENVELPLRARGISKKERIKRIDEQLKRCGILDQKEKYPRQLSGGQQQRCAIARALVTDCKLLLADEPTGALDYKTAEEIMALLCSLKSLGTTIVMVTHDKNMAAYADRIIYMQDGKLVGGQDA